MVLDIFSVTTAVKDSKVVGCQLMFTPAVQNTHQY